MRKQLAAAGLTAGLAVGGVAGFAFTSGTASVGAQDGTTTTTAAPGAKAPRPDRGARLQETLKPLVDDGTITQAQADKVIAALDKAGPFGGAGDRGPRGGMGGMGRMGGGMFGVGLDAVAKALGVTTDELKADLQKGTSIADIAKSHNVDLSKITDAVVAEATTRIDEQVKNGKITQTQADERIAQLKKGIAAMLDGTMPEGGPGRGGPGGWGHGPMGGDPKDGGAPKDGAAPATEPPATEAPTTTAG